jgi:autotransporter-associated beta strand protein
MELLTNRLVHVMTSKQNAAALSLLVILLSASRTQAAPDTWSGSAATTSWATGSNWSATTPPGTGDVATFDSTAYTSLPNLDANTPQTIGGIAFGDGTTAAAAITISATSSASTTTQKTSGSTTSGSTSITLTGAGAFVGEQVTGAGIAAGTFVTAVSGNTFTISQGATATIPTSTQLTFIPALTVGSSGITVNAGVTGTQTISAPIIVGAPQIWTNNATLADALTVSGAIYLGSNGLTLAGAASSSGTISGVIAGTGSLTVNTSGSYVLTGANSFTGGVTLTAGTLQLGNGSAIGTGTLTLGGGTLYGGSGGISLTTNNAQVWNGSFTASSSTSHTLNLGNGAITISGPLTLTVSAGTFTDSGTISGGNGIFDVTKAGGGLAVFATGVAVTGTETLNVTGGYDVFTGTFTGSNTGINIVGGGAVALSGANGNAASSAITATGSTTLDFDSTASGVVGTTRAGSVTLSRGFLTVNGNAGANSVDNVTGTLTVDGSNGFMDVVTVTPNASKNTQLTAAALAQTNGAVVLFNGTNLGTNSISSATAGSSNISFTTAPTLIGGGGAAGTTTISILPNALGGTTGSDTGSTFVTYTAANGIRPLTAAEFASSETDGSTTNDNLKLAASTTFNSNTTFNSLIVSGSANETIGGTGTLTITSGAVLLNPTNSGSNTSTINSALNFGTAQGYIGASYNRNTSINGVISGSGGLTLYQVTQNGDSATINFGSSGQNTYTGNTYILGSVTLGSQTALPAFSTGGRTGDVYIGANGTLRLTTFGGGTASMNGLNGSGLVIYTNSAAEGLSLGDNNATGTFTGAINNSSGGLLSLTKIGTGTETLSGTNNTIRGAVSIQNGALAVTTLNSVTGGVASSSLGAPTSATNATIALGSTMTTGELSDIGTGETTDRVINLAGTTGGGILDQSGTGLLKFTSNFTATGAGSKTLTLQGSTTGAGEIDGQIVNNSTLNTTSLVKAGTGTWTLTGSNTYSGGTTVNGGTLLASNTVAGGSATGTGSLTVNAGATFGGNGTSSGTSFSVTGTATSARANVLVGLTSVADTTVGNILTLKGSTGTSTIADANLTFNLSATSTASNQLSVGATNIGFGTDNKSVLFSLNLQGEPAIVPNGTLYTLIAGIGSTSTGVGSSTGQYTGLTLGNSTTVGGVTETIITGNNLQVAFGSSVDTSYYGNGSYLVLYQSAGVDDIDVVVVPEPGTWALMLGGLTALVFWQRRKRNN